MNEAKTAATAGTEHEQQIAGSSAKTDKAGNSNMKCCKACGATITAKYRSKYCSNECSDSKRRELRNKNRRLCYKNNPEKYRDNTRQWYRNNPEKARKNSSRWYRNNPEKAMESSMRWQKKNPEKVREYIRRRNAKRRKIIKENTERWVENYMAKVREGARIEREAEEENAGINGRQPNKEVGVIADGAETI